MSGGEASERLGANGVAIVKETCVPSLNPKICLGTSIKGGGRGLYAKERIAKGEWTWREVEGMESIPRTWEFVEALPEASKRAYLHFAYYIGNNKFSSLPEFDTLDVSEWPTTPSRDESMYMNHSCDPTSWFVYPGGTVTAACDEMWATRDIEPGEEITFDYGTSEIYPQWHAFECKCGVKDCRGALSPHDWRTLHMQRKYAGRFLIHVAEAISKVHTTDLYDLRVEDGKLKTGKAITAGATVLIIPPNRLVTGSEVADKSKAFKVGDDLWSAPLFEEDLSQYVSGVAPGHANLTGMVSADNVIEFTAARDIAAGEALTVDAATYKPE